MKPSDDCRTSLLFGKLRRLQSRLEIRVELTLILFLAAFMLGGEDANAELIWSAAVNLGPNVNSPSNDAGASTSADGLTLYFSSNRSGGSGGYDLWSATRETVYDDWGPAVNLGQPPNSRYSYWKPSISSDGLTLYFSDGHLPQFGNPLPGGLGGQGDIWMATRASIYDAWGAPINLGPAVNSQHAIHPSISHDSLSLYFQSHRSGALGHCDIMVATRESMFDSFGDPVFLKNVNNSGPDWTPDISADGLTLFFTKNPGPTEAWASTRRTVDDDFGAPIRLPHQVNMPGCDNSIPHLSADGSTLYFLSNRPGGFGGWDLWQVPIIPVVDFNGDGTVEITDLLRLIEHWGLEDPSCDIAPAPFGDGVVDAADLEVLMSYWGQEIDDPTLVAHWKLDETEGIVAHDAVGGNHDGTVMGIPAWQLEAGKIGGALELDGTTFVGADCVLGPSEGPFSVFAWIKGGAPGQVAVSQQEGADWLMLDPTTGALMTELRSGGRQSKPLYSEVVLTDGTWHRVGFTWDGTDRRLYVDDLLVAEDTDVALTACDGGLNIGCGKSAALDTFFSGLIDDVRIYNRAVKP